jgi:hypothetical protein
MHVEKCMGEKKEGREKREKRDEDLALWLAQAQGQRGIRVRIRSERATRGMGRFTACCL